MKADIDVLFSIVSFELGADVRRIITNDCSADETDILWQGSQFKFASFNVRFPTSAAHLSNGLLALFRPRSIAASIGPHSNASGTSNVQKQNNPSKRPDSSD